MSVPPDLQDVLSSLLPSGATPGRGSTLDSLGLEGSRLARLLQEAGGRLGVNLLSGEQFDAGGSWNDLRDFVEDLQRASFPGLGASALESSEPAPLSFAQEYFWVLQRLSPGTSVVSEADGFRLRGALDLGRWTDALRALPVRHPVLAARFEDHSGATFQQRGAAPVVKTTQLPNLSHADRAAAAQAAVDRCASQPVALADPLFRAEIVVFAPDDCLVILARHRSLADRWSLNVLLNDLAAWVGSGVPASAEPAVGQAKFAVWQRQRAELRGEDTFWQTALEGASPQLVLPSDRPRPTMLSIRGGRVPLALPAELCRKVRAFAAARGLPERRIFEASLALLLHRCSDEERIAFASYPAIRRALGSQGSVGAFDGPVLQLASLSAHATVEEVVRKYAEHAAIAESAADVPFSVLATALRTAGGQPLQVPAALRWDPELALPAIPGVEISQLTGDSGTTLEPLSFELRPEGEGVVGQLRYSKDLFDAATAERLLGQWVGVVSQLVAAPSAQVQSLSLLTPVERKQLVEDWNSTSVPLPPFGVHQLFEAQVDRTPDAVALEHGGKSLTYRQLDEQANRLAALLRAEGVGPESRVVVAMEPGAPLIVSLYGVLKAGAAYVPLDPEAPAERLQFIAAQVGAKVTLTSPQAAQFVGTLTARVLTLDPELAVLAGASSARVATASSPSNLAYVIFTSGSTGEPKGVWVEHRSVVNHNLALAQRMALKPGDRLLQFTPVIFDAAGEEIYPTLLAGAALVIRGELVPTYELSDLVKQQRVSVLSLPPAYMHEWLLELERKQQKIPSEVRLVILGGEKLLPESLRLWHRLGGGHIPWFNVYGPTEATVTSALCEIQGEQALAAPLLPIGRPIANARMYLLDRGGMPVPVGLPGEIFIGGLGLARGYGSRPAETAERFTPDPFSSAVGARMYRTGDVGRFLPDGRIEFLGRADFQVKIRGFRIELGEVENTLRLHPTVHEAVAIARDDTKAGPRLVAYLVLKPGIAPSSTDLKSFVRTRLPDYMVPSAFVTLPALPLTPGGKVDRKALPPPADTASDAAEYAEPQSDLQKRISAVWAELLSAPRVGLNDDFFELGGQSLTVMQVVSRLLEVGIEVEVRDIFEAPTVGTLSDRLANRVGQPTADADALSDDEVSDMLQDLLKRSGGA